MIHRTSQRMSLVSLLVVALLAAACSIGKEATPAPTPTATRVPTPAPTPTPAPIPPPADIVKSGNLRVALDLQIGFLAKKDPAAGATIGVEVDLGRELAKRLGIAYVPVEYATPDKILEGFKAGEWDVVMVPIQTGWETVLESTAAYIQIPQTLLVPGSSAIRTFADADKPGTRIAFSRVNGTLERLLTGLVKQATLVRPDSSAAALDLIKNGDADALAAGLDLMPGLVGQLPGSRILDDRFGVQQHVAYVAKGRTDLLAYVREFLEQAKASGLIKQALAGRLGVEVAPAAR